MITSWIVLNYITLNSIFTFNEIRVKYHESLMIQFLTREIKERGQIPRDLGKLCTRAIYRESSENGHNWETEGKLASRNSAFPTSENNNLPVCTCSMHRIAR